MRKRIILLNPPAPEVYQKDHYCSTSSKTGYYWPPIDLLLNSGVLATEFDVTILDAIVENLEPRECLSRIEEARPDAVLCLTSILTLETDLAFLAECKRATGCRNVICGDIAYARPEVLVEHEALDAVCLQYPAKGLPAWLKGEAPHDDLVVKRDGKVVRGATSTGKIEYGIPAHGEFKLDRYRMPLVRQHPFGLFITSLSCPMSCSYCPVQDVDYRERDFDELFRELDSLKQAGVKELLIHDLMFNSNPARTKRICREMIRRGYKFGWSCLMRPDRADEELLSLAKEAGCHTISFGVESTDPAILRENRRQMDLEKTRAAFDTCGRVGITSLAIVLLGLPGETRKSALETIRFVCSLRASYLSLNVFVPRVGSRYMAPMRSLGEILRPWPELDSNQVLKSYCTLTTKELLELRRYALRRFYLNPFRLFRILASMCNFTQLRETALTGFRLLTRFS